MGRPLIRVVDDLDMSWQEQANCRGVDPDLFFPARGKTDLPAKAVCAGCAVRVECLAYALEYEPMGVWGGASARQRRAMKQRRWVA